MYTAGIMDSKSDLNSAVCDSSREWRLLIYFSIVFSNFQGSNEKKWMVTEERASIVKCRETSFEGEGF